MIDADAPDAPVARAVPRRDGPAPPEPRPLQDRTVGEFVWDAAADVFGVDGRLWRTLSALVRAPGLMTATYVSGQDGGFLRPTRTYLAFSLVVFTLVRLSDPGGALGRALLDFERSFLAGGSADAQVERVLDLERVREATLADRASAERDLAEVDGLLDAARRGERSEEVAAFLVPLPDDAAQDQGSTRLGGEERLGLAQAEVAGTFLELLPVLLIVLVPVYALGVYLLAGQRRSGVVAVVFAVYAHAAGFGALALVAMLAVGAGWGVGWMALLPAAVSLAVWQSAALQRVYGATPGRSWAVAVGWGGAYALGALAVLGVVYLLVAGVTVLGLA